jgi:xylulokinase
MFLGIDLGTSELKLLLLDERHHIVATTGERLTLQRPQALWSEQHPADWWAAMDTALQRLASQQPDAMAAVQAIGLSGQMHGAVVLDAAGQVLRPAILWNDGRSGSSCAALEAAVPGLHGVTGNLAMPGFTAPKLLWLREHEPAVFERVRSVLLPKDWLRFGLTGEKVSEMSDASGTLWLDVGRRRWSPEVLAACGLGVEHMPRLVEGSAVSAPLLPGPAARWGLKAGIPVAGGGGDNAASAVGIGAVRPGQGFVSLGTSGVIFLASDRFRPNPASAMHAFCHALPNTWHQMSVMLSAASALRWACGLLGLPNEEALLERVASLTPAQQAAAPLFLPYLSGERTPHNDPRAQGVLFGLGHQHDAASVGYAVIEGVAFGLRDGWASMNVVPADVAQLSLVGGGARSALWATLIASTLGVPLVTHEGGEAGGALGAARLACLAQGGDPGAVCASPPIRDRVEPDARLAALLAPRYERFRRLYPALSLHFGASG